MCHNHCKYCNEPKHEGECDIVLVKKRLDLVIAKMVKDNDTLREMSGRATGYERMYNALLKSLEGHITISAPGYTGVAKPDEFDISDSAIRSLCNKSNAAINGEGEPPQLEDLVSVIVQLMDRLKGICYENHKNKD